MPAPYRPYFSGLLQDIRFLQTALRYVQWSLFPRAVRFCLLPDTAQDKHLPSVFSALHPLPAQSLFPLRYPHPARSLGTVFHSPVPQMAG